MNPVVDFFCCFSAVKRIFSRVSWFLGAAALFVSVSSQAAMVLSQAIVYFDADGKPTKDIIVTNPDDETLYLQTEVHKVINPGELDEKRIKADDPNDVMLLVTPNKMIIPAKTSKTIRLVSLDIPKGKETVYRVTFRPVVGKLKATQTAIKILVAYQALIFVRPENPISNVIAQREGKRVTFTNNGTINVMLRNGKLCYEDKKPNCKELENNHRLYAGQSWTIFMPDDEVNYISYGLFDGHREKKVDFLKSS